MRNRMVLYLLVILLVSPVGWGAILFFSGYYDLAGILAMLTQPILLVYGVIFIILTLIWLNRLVLASAARLQEGRASEGDRRHISWFPIALLAITVIYPLLG